MQPHRSLPGGQQRALRHPEHLLALRHDERPDAAATDAEGRGAVRCQGRHAVGRRRDAGDHHRQAELSSSTSRVRATASACSSPANRPSGSTSCHSRLRAQLAALPGLEGVHSEARSGEEQVQIIVDRDRAAQLGLTSEDVAGTVAAAMRGDRLTRAAHSEREVTMRLAFRASDRQAIEDLACAADHAARRLDASASAPSPTFRRRARRPRQIERVNRLTAVVIAANLTTGTHAGRDREGASSRS